MDTHAVPSPGCEEKELKEKRAEGQKTRTGRKTLLPFRNRCW